MEAIFSKLDERKKLETEKFNSSIPDVNSLKEKRRKEDDNAEGQGLRNRLFIDPHSSEIERKTGECEHRDFQGMKMNSCEGHYTPERWDIVRSDRNRAKLPTIEKQMQDQCSSTIFTDKKKSFKNKEEIGKEIVNPALPRIRSSKLQVSKNRRLCSHYVGPNSRSLALQRQVAAKTKLCTIRNPRSKRRQRNAVKMSVTKSDPLARVRWSGEEEEVLVLGVQLHGAGKWMKILNEFKDVFHCARTNVNLKDKWRNLVNRGLAWPPEKEAKSNKASEQVGRSVKPRTQKKSPFKGSRGKGNSGEYEVEKIIDVRKRLSADPEYLIRWKGYSCADDTWEKSSHLNCPALLQKFYLQNPSKASPFSRKRGVRIRQTPRKGGAAGKEKSSGAFGTKRKRKRASN